MIALPRSHVQELVYTSYCNRPCLNTRDTFMTHAMEDMRYEVLEALILVCNHLTAGITFDDDDEEDTLQIAL